MERKSAERVARHRNQKSNTYATDSKAKEVKEPVRETWKTFYKSKR